MGTIAGRVSDLSGVGIPDVYVEYIGSEGSLSVLTAADGTFSVDVDPGDYWVYFSPFDDVHVPEYWNDGNLFTVAEGATVTLNAQLASYGTISGTVADDAGHALDDVYVYLYDAGGIYVNTWRYTGDDGVFAFTFVAPGDYRIFFDNVEPLYTDEWWQDATSQDDADLITLGDGAGVTLPTAHITTVPTGAISGTVRDAETLTGLANVTAVLQRDDGHSYYSSADAAGRYEFDEVPNGTYTLHFQNPGGIDWYLDEWWDDASSAASATPIVVAGGSDLTLNADLTPSPVGSLSGTLTNSAGQPITSGYVEVYATSGHNAGGSRWVYVDALGHYEFPRLVAGDYQVHFDAQTDFYIGEWWNNQPTQGAADLFTISDGVSSTLNATLASAPTGTLTGTVTDDDATEPDGLADVSVQVYNADTGYSHYATTDADGQYSLVVPAGIYYIWFGASYPYIGEYWHDGEYLTVPEGGTAVADAALALQAPAAPDAPWCLGAEVALPGNGVGSGEVRLSWCTPNENGAAITDYVIQYSGNGGSTWSTFADGTSTGNQSTVTGLGNGTPYLFRVAAVNSVGQSDWTTTNTTATPRGVPGAPTNLGVDVAPASGIGSGQARLTWTAAPSNGAAITDYLVQYSTNGGTSWTTYNDGTSTSTTAVLSSLSNGTLHLFRVLAVNVAGQSSPSATVSATPNTGIGVPGVPTGLTAQVALPSNSLTSGQVGLSWTAPVSDGGAPISDYFVEYSSNGGTTWTIFADGTSTSTSATVTGLTNGTPYTFRVRAGNVAGQGSPSATVAATPRSVPGVPTGLAAEVAPEIGVGSGEVRVSWTVPVNAGGSPITDYVVQYSSNGGSTWTTFADATSTATTAMVTGLTNGTGYAFRVAAVNAAGQGALSATVTATPRTVPAAPTGLAAESAPASGVGSGQLRLSWTAPANTGGSPITDYVVQYSSNGGTTWTTFADGTSTTTTVMVTGLTNGTEYTLRVFAVNAAGQGAASATAVATPSQPPDVPDAPTGLTATVAPNAGAGSGEVRVSWTAPANNGAAISDYVVEYSSNGGSSWSTFADGTSPATSAMVTGLTNGTQYTFRVAAMNSVGQGVASASATATPRTVPGAPSGLSPAVAPVSGVGSGEVALSWIAPISNGGSAISDYVVEYSSNGGSSWSTFNDGTSTATSATVSGLTNGTLYTFRVSAVNAAGTGAASATVTAIPRSVPGVPTGLAATVALPANGVGSGEVALSWTAPAANGGSAITDYVVEYSSNGGSSWSTFNDATSTVTSATVTGLSNGTAYTFRVSAVNAAGTGAASVTVSATPRTVPGAPTGLTATVALPANGVGSGEVRLSWTAPPNGGSILVDYVVQYSSDGGSSWTSFADGTSTVTSATVTGLSNGTAYTFRVSAVNAAGTGAASATTSATPRTVPGSPTGLMATPGSTQVALSWTAPAANGGSTISDYVVEYSSNGGTSWTSFADGTSTVTSATVTGLSNGTAYTFRVSAVNAAGTGVASAVTSATPRTVPGSPTGLMATPGSTQVALSWTAPAANGGSTISDYVVEYSSNGGSSWSTFADGTSTVTSATVTGLSNGTVYTFRVSAVNAAGTGVASATTSATPSTGVSAPGAPTGLAATVALPANGVGSGEVRLSWTAPISNGGSAITDYVVEYSSNGGSSWSTFADGTSTVTSATVTGLTNGTAYTFRVAAVNAAGTGAASATTSATPRTVPGAPTGLAATPGSTQVGLSWTAPVSSGGSAITDYVVEYSSNGGSSWSTFADATSTATSATVSGLTNGTAYTFRVSAVNAAGTGAASATTSATPRTVPGAPTGLTATVALPANSVGSGEVALSWTAPPNGGSILVDYVVEYSSNGGSSWSTFADGTSTVTSVTVSGLTNGTAYSFRVAAVNAAGTGAASATVSATPRTVPGAPTGLAATPGSTQVGLSWTAPVSSGGSAITDYVVEYSSNGGSSWSTFADATSTATSATVTGLSNGTGYTFRVAATNAAGTGAASTTVTATPSTVPGAATASIDCVNEAIRITNDGTAPIVGYGSTIGSRREIPAGGSATVPWGRDPGGNLLDPSTWEAYTINADTSETLFDSGSFTLAQYEAQCEAEEELTYSYTAEPVCVAEFPHVRFTATGTGDVYIAQNTHSAGLAMAGGPPITLPWDEHQAIPFPETDWEAVRTDTHEVFDTGSFTLAEDNPCVTATVPGVPSGLAATPGSTQVALSWTAPAANGGSTISDYVVEYSSNGGSSWSTFADGTSTVTSATVSGLTNGTAYTFRVAATNTAGTGAASATTSATPRTVPGAPTGLTATPGSAQVALSWTAPAANGGSTITDYVVEYSSNGGSSWSTFADGTSTVTSATVSGLTNGTAHTFRVSAVNAAGTGAASATTSTTPASAVTVPGAPTGLTAAVAPASGVGPGAVRLSWTAPVSNGGSAITDYVVQYSSNGGSSWSTFNDGTSTLTSATVSGLTNGTAYTFRVSAVNAAGIGATSVTVSATPRTKPGAPQSVTAVVAPASGVGSGQVKVSWSAPTSNGGSPITAYVVQRSTNGTTWATVATTGTTARSHVATGLSNGTRYHFRVLARNAVGDTASATVSATPRTRSSAPRLVVAVVAPAPTVGSGQVGIGWLAPASTGGSAITGYVIQRSSNGSAWTTLAVASASTRTFKATGLTNGTRYYFRVLARNVVGDTASATVSAVPRTVPSAPRAVTATPGSRQVKLTWATPSANGGSAIAGYAVQRWTGTRWTTISTAAASARSFTATGLSNGTRYNFRVIAINGAGFGSPSSTVSAVPR